MVAAFVFNTQSNSVDPAFLDDFKNVKDATEELRMANPRFAGIDENGKPFEVTALAAKQAPDARDIVELDRPRAVQGGDDKTSAVTADNGTYRSEDKILELTNDVQLEHKIGAENYVLRLPTATVIMDEETVVGDAGVGGEGSDGAQLSADRMKAYRADGRVVFEGNVSMRIYPKSASFGQPKTDETTDTEPKPE